MPLQDRILLAASALIVGTAVAAGPVVQRLVERPAGADSLADTAVRGSYEDALGVVAAEYAGPYDIDTANKHAVQGMLRTLDPHSTYFDARAYAELKNEQQSQFYGIGVTINRRNERVYVLGAIPGTPAQRAGLRYGDAITAVDGKLTSGLDTEEVLDSVRGEIGTPVELTIERAGSPEPLTFTIVRDSVPLPTVRNSFMLEGTVGYVGLTGGFSSTTDEELGEAIDALKARGMEQLVLDMRNNPGGLLDEAIKVAQRFLPAGERILVIRGRSGGSRGEIVYTSKNPSPETMPLVILINRGTASAAEVVTGGLQDHDRAYVVGETSFGKGLVQTVFTLNFNTGLTLTTSKYYTPTGRSIQRDYANTSLYDYYLKRTDAGEAAEPPKGEALLTDSGRTVYGGGGITPDIAVPPHENTTARVRIFLAAFEFVRHLVAGQVAGLEEFRVEKPDYDHELRGDEYRITEPVLTAFRAFVTARPELRVSAEAVDAHLDYARDRVREEVITAAYGTDAGNQFGVLNDRVARAALDALPKARQLAEAARALRDRR